ncbi:jg13437 [Pararge aegeria aegeria]|uniref:Jg13437 protein n=1 Tax=Pararge aegeria aegeria TaxID=348720 RepID=A0A8S4QTY4_9NEOP|nr:jg13437 [Pararge aegeria aegeria]
MMIVFYLTGNGTCHKSGYDAKKHFAGRDRENQNPRTTKNINTIFARLVGVHTHDGIPDPVTTEILIRLLERNRATLGSGTAVRGVRCATHSRHLQRPSSLKVDDTLKNESPVPSDLLKSVL